jgi:hypothetical protein
MAEPSDEFKRQYAYFHSVGKTLIEQNQNPFESLYSSGHVTFSNVVLTQTIPHFDTEAEADLWILSNPGILQKYTLQTLTELPGSNGQTWYINDGGTWIRPLITEALAPDPVTNEPSNGLIPRLYRSDNTLIPPTDGVWLVDPWQGIVKFEEGYTPSDQGYGTPKLTCYAYVGSTLSDGISGMTAPVSAINVAFDNTQTIGISATNVQHAIEELYDLVVDGSTIGGQIVINETDYVYVVSDSSIETSSIPVCTVVMPMSGELIIVPSIFDIQNGSFKVELSTTPDMTGYYLNWVLAN